MLFRLCAALVAAATLLSGIPVPGESLDESPVSLPRVEFSGLASSIEVSARVEGEAVVGSAFEVIVSATSPIDLPRARITLETPPGVEASGGQRLALPQGQPVTVAFQVTVHEPGLHPIKASVVQQARGPPAWGADVVYLQSGEGHATIHAAAPVPAMPAAARAVAASNVRTAPTGHVPGASPEPWLSSESLTSARGVETFTIAGCWTFVDPDGQTLWPQRWATVRVLELDDDGTETLAVGFTGEDGCITSPPIPVLEPAHQAEGGTPQELVFQVDLCNSAICAAADQVLTFWSFALALGEPITEPGAYLLGNLAPPDPVSQAAGRAFQYANNAWDFAVNHMGLDPGQLGDVTVRIPFLEDDAAAFFVGAEDTIYLGLASMPESPDVVAHEYGHFVMDKLYDDLYDPSFGGTHYLCQDNQDPGLSWSEGWANYFGARANREVVAPGADGDTLLTQAGVFSLPMEDRACPTSIAGYDDEVNVAQFLWDLRDAESESLRSTRLGIPGVDNTALDHAVIVDGLVHCYDANLGDYFNGLDPDSFSPACNWDTLGHDVCGFVKTALWNRIDVNTRPVTTVTQPAAGTVSGVFTAAATVEDPDCPDILGVQFGLFRNSDCTGRIDIVGVDRQAPFEIEIDSERFGNLPEVWVCARAHDNLHGGSWASARGPVEFVNGPS